MSPAQGSCLRGWSLGQRGGQGLAALGARTELAGVGHVGVGGGIHTGAREEALNAGKAKSGKKMRNSGLGVGGPGLQILK